MQYQSSLAIDLVTQAFSSKLREHLSQRSDDPNHIREYVNYAHGKETPQEVYSWDEWRLEKHKSLDF